MSPDDNFSGADGERESFGFLVQLVTIKIGDHTLLILKKSPENKSYTIHPLPFLAALVHGMGWDVEWLSSTRCVLHGTGCHMVHGFGEERKGGAYTTFSKPRIVQQRTSSVFYDFD